jgi:serine/threonine-protein kinase HipA
VTSAIKNQTISHLKCAKVKTLLYLIGENLDKNRAHYQAETGKLVQLMRGIYVDAAADIDADLPPHKIPHFNVESAQS